MEPKTKRGKHPKSLANLRPPWRPGEAPNPRGVNHKRPWTERYAITSEAPLPEELRKKFNKSAGCEVLAMGATWADAAIIRRHLEALEIGGTPAAKEIADRIEGKTTVFEEERVDAKEAHVYLIAPGGVCPSCGFRHSGQDDKRVESTKKVTANVEITGWPDGTGPKQK